MGLYKNLDGTDVVGRARFALGRAREGGLKMEQDVSANSIRQLRKSLGLTQEEFAHAVAVTFSTVNRWENGHAKPSKLARRAIEALSTVKAGPAEATRPSLGMPVSESNGRERK